MSQNVCELKQDEFLCLQGDLELDMYYLQEGELLVLTQNNTKLTPLALIQPGQFIGELSYFDHLPRSAHIICTKPSTLVRIPQIQKNQLPNWITKLFESYTKDLRHLDSIIAEVGIKKSKATSIQALTPIEEKVLLDKIQVFRNTREN